MKKSSLLLWGIWGVSAVALTYWLAGRLQGEEREIFLPGATTDGHYQIELACDACHTQRFTQVADFQSACEGCHSKELEDARDTHPQSKFTDPRNADRVAMLDARYCVTCHVEHRPERTQAMAVTLPDDFCSYCHQDIATDRPSHAGMEFATCASSGCHNFHDNRSIYEDFLLRHAEDRDTDHDAVLPARNFASIAAYLDAYPKEAFPLQALTAALADAPAGAADAAAIAEWAASAHARSGVNCTACHSASAGDWDPRPGHEACAQCHTNETGGFLDGRHGMRLDVDAHGAQLPPMSPAAARLPMNSESHSDSLTCNTCHPAHEYDTAVAAADACTGCHDDSHSRAYAESPHARLVVGDGAGPAVTCASCHMPRTNVSYQYGAFNHVLVQHNQNDNLRPNEKMIRSVCLECHGLGFSIDALADRDLIERNFNGAPGEHIASIDLAVERRRQVEAERARERAAAADRQGRAH